MIWKRIKCLFGHPPKWSWRIVQEIEPLQNGKWLVRIECPRCRKTEYAERKRLGK